MKRIMAITLGLVGALSLCGCNGNEGSSQSSGSSSSGSGNNATQIDFDGSNASYETHGDVEESIHQINHTPTSKYILLDNACDYSVVIPDDASNDLLVYVKEFISLFEEATNVTLELVYEKDYSSSGKFFSFGNTTLFTNSGISMEYEQLKTQGYIIKTIDEGIYMNGFTDASCIYAAYKYLSIMFNYDFFGPNTYKIDKNVTSVPLEDFDIIDAPDIEYRMGSYGFANGSTGRKYGLSVDDSFMTVGGIKWHNTFAYLPPETYKDTHPEWYSDDGTQLCYTAHGNEESKQEMIDNVTKTIQTTMIENPTKNVISFSIQDSNTFCDCDTCSASKIKYNGANSAVIIQFLNQVSDNIHEWFETEEGKPYERDLKILFFAYLSTNVAPTNYDKETDTYSPIDESVVCNDDVCVFFADIRGDYTHSFYDMDSANDVYIESMKAWTSVSKQFFFWMYSTNFKYYLTPYNSFNAVQNTYKFAVSCNAVYLYDQGQYNQGSAATGFSFLKQYISSKLLWNVNLNQEELIKDFFDYFYSSQAASIMKNLFDEYRVLATYQTEVLGFSGASSIYHEALKSTYWPKNTLLRYIDILQEAIDAIEPLRKTDSGSYQTYYKHITCERVAFVYMLLKIYNSTLSDEELTSYKKMFHEDANNNGMIYEGEGGSLISDILN